MTRDTWRIRVRGEQREEPDMGLLVEAVLLFAREETARRLKAEEAKPNDSEAPDEKDQQQKGKRNNAAD